MASAKTEPLAGWSTRAVHAGQEQAEPEFSLTTPVYLTSTYVFPDTQSVIDYRAGNLDHPEYGRYYNPTQRVAEKKIASLEGAQDALLFSSGMAAITATMLAVLKTGDHVIATHDCYHGIRNLITQHLSRWGIEHTIVKTGDWQALEDAIRPTTRMMFTETPTNPYLNVVDLERFCAIAKKHKIKTVIDATFSTPINTRPHEFGIDIVIHSCTKYLAGHNDTMSGVVTGKRGFVEVIREFQAITGGIAGPFDAYLLIRGLKTLSLRVQQANKSALAIAEFCHAHPKIERVCYPLHPSHPNYEIACKQMSGGGGVVSFVLRGGLDAAKQFCDALKIPKFGPSLGGVESLFQAPALLSYGGMTADERAAVGIEDGLIRYSVGVEDTEDLLRDLSQALDRL